MNNFDIVVIGLLDLYVCGKGTSGFGTILPAIFEWKRQSPFIEMFTVLERQLSRPKKYQKRRATLRLKLALMFQ